MIRSLIIQRQGPDMRAFGQAVRSARERRGWSRDEFAEILDLSTRYVMYIETRGQHPSLQVLFRIALLLDISLDQFFFPGIEAHKSALRRQLDTVLDDMDDRQLFVLSGTAKALREAEGA